MAVTIAEAVAEKVDTSNASTYDFGAFSPNTNKILVVLAGVTATVATGSMVNVSGTSLTWKQAGRATWASGANTMYAYWALTPGSTSSSVYRVDVTGDAGTACIAYMFEFSGAHYNSINPIRQIKFGANTASTNATVTFNTAMDTNNGYCAAWWGALSSSNPANVSTPPSTGGGWTEIGDNGLANPTTNASGAYRATGETGTSVTFTNNSTNWGCVAVELFADGAGPSGLELYRNDSNMLMQARRTKPELIPY